MSNKTVTTLALAAGVALSAVIGAGSSHAADKDMDAMVGAIHAKQADARMAVSALVAQSRAKGLSPKVIAMLDGESRSAVSSKLAALEKGIQSKQAVSRARISAMVKTARVLDINPQHVAMMEGDSLDIGVASGPQD